MMGSHATAIANAQLPAPSVGTHAADVGLRGEWLCALLEGFGDADLAKLRRGHRLTEGVLREPLCRVPIDTVAAVLEQAARLSGDPLIALHLVERRRPRGLLHYLLVSQENLGASIDRLIRFAGVLCSGATIRLSGRGETRALVLWPSRSRPCPEVAAACLATICFDLRDATNGRVRFEEVRLRGRAERPAADYERIFGCPVRFEQPDDALVLPALDLRIRMRRRNRVVADRLEAAARWELETLAQATMRERVEAILHAMLGDGESCRRATVAWRLGCSTRALRRALESEGTSFREIEAQVRRQVALALVAETDLSLAQVAAHCGFAGLPAFSKAFRRWTVCAPSAFRQMQVAAAYQERSRRAVAARAQANAPRRHDDASHAIRPIARRQSS